MQRAVTRIAVIASAALLIGASAPSLAHAQSRAAALLPPGGDATQSPKVKAEILRAATHVLTTLGYQVHSPEAVQRALKNNGFGECTEATCAPAVFSSIDAELVVLTRVWNKDGKPFEVSMHLTRMRPGVPKPRIGRAVLPLGDAGIQSAVQAAVAEALRDTEKDSVRLVLRGTPEGATVVIDGEPKGTLPLALDLHAGKYSLVVSADGFREETQTLDLHAGASAPIVLDLALERNDGTNDAKVALLQSQPSRTNARTEYFADAPKNGKRTRRMVLGWGLVGLGVAALVPPAIALAERGECIDDLADGLCEKRAFGVSGWLWVGVSTALLTTGTILLFRLPEKTQLSANLRPQGAFFSAQTQF